MRCSGCGTDIPDDVVFCPSCGRKLDEIPKHGQDRAMPRCPSCGRAIQPEFKACPYCGHSFVAPLSFEPPADISSGKRIGLYILSILIPLVGLIVGAIYLSKKDEVSKHVGTICLVLGIVSIVVIAPIAGAVVLYLMVVDFGGTDLPWTPQATYAKQTIVNGEKITIMSVTTADVPWDDITIVLTESATSNAASWNPVEDQLDDGFGDSMNCSDRMFGSLTVACWVYDIMGNGVIDGGDYITVFTYGGAGTFSGTYQVQFFYEPTAEQIGTPVTWTS